MSDAPVTVERLKEFEDAIDGWRTRDFSTRDWNEISAALRDYRRMMEEGAIDSRRLDYLEKRIDTACVTTCWEMDGGIHLTIEEPGRPEEAYRNQTCLRLAIDNAMRKVQP